jgi:hypothetical protein
MSVTSTSVCEGNGMKSWKLADGDGGEGKSAEQGRVRASVAEQTGPTGLPGSFLRRQPIATGQARQAWLVKWSHFGFKEPLRSCVASQFSASNCTSETGGTQDLLWIGSAIAS